MCTCMSEQVEKPLGLRSRFSDQLDITAGKRCWDLNEKCGVPWSSTPLTPRLADFNSLVSELPVLVMIYYCASLSCALDIQKSRTSKMMGEIPLTPPQRNFCSVPAVGVDGKHIVRLIIMNNYEVDVGMDKDDWEILDSCSQITIAEGPTTVSGLGIPCARDINWVWLPLSICHTTTK